MHSEKSQVEMHGPITITNGHMILASPFGDHAQIGFNGSPKSTRAKESVQNNFYGVPAENLAFIDRSNILADMEAVLGKSSSSSGCRILALTGLGGMGKTQLMLQYCYIHHARYDFVFWLEVDSWSTAVDSFRKLAINLGLRNNAAEKDSEENIIGRVRSWLQRRTKWLLLLDNADNDEMDKKVFNLIPRIGGDVILTSQVYIPPTRARTIRVDKMQKEEAICLLLGIPSITSVDQESTIFYYAQEIVTLLDNMPLAINLARAYVDNTGATFQHYLTMFKTKRDILFRYHDEDSSVDYNHTLSTVWQLSLERVQTQNPMAVKILEACSFLQPDNIPVCFFERQYSALELQSGSLALSETEQECEAAIREAIVVLTRFSFVTWTRKKVESNKQDTTNELLIIHRLVQKFIDDTMNDEQRLHWAHNIAAALDSETYFSFTDVFTPKTRGIMDVYLSHIHHFIMPVDNLHQKPLLSEHLKIMLDRTAFCLLSYGTYYNTEEFAQLAIQISETMNGKEHPETAKSLDKLAWLYKNQGKYNDAEPLYQQSLAIYENVLGSEHLNTARSLNELASTYSHQSKYNDAEPLYQRALAIYEKVGHPDTATSLNKLAWLYYNQGKYNDAKPLFQRALAIYEKVFGLEHPYTATSLSSLAALYSNWGKYNDAEPLYQRALAIREKVLGSEHPDTAASLNNLASLYNSQGKYNDAEPLYQRALAIREKVLGSEHPYTAASLNNLASLYKNQGKYNDAEPLYQRALAIREKLLGSEHPDVAISLSTLASLYNNRGKYKNTEPLYQRALAIREKKLGSEHPYTATSLSTLASLYYNQGKYNNAEPLYLRALAIRQKVLGSEHPRTATSLDDLALLYKNQGKYNYAEPLYQRALAIREKVLRSEHPDTATSLNNLALLYYNQGKYNDAKPLYQRALAIREKVLGSEHPKTATSLDDLALLYKNQGKYDEAETLFRRALVIREKVLGSEHPDTATSLNNLALINGSLGKYKEAELLCQRALVIREEMLGSKHPHTATSWLCLATLYEHQGRYDEAETLYKQALTLYKKALASDHPDTARLLNNLAELYKGQGKYEEAEPLYQQALATRKKVLGPEHPDTKISAKNLTLFNQIRALHPKTSVSNQQISQSATTRKAAVPGTAALEAVATIKFTATTKRPPVKTTMIPRRASSARVAQSAGNPKSVQVIASDEALRKTPSRTIKVRYIRP